MLEKMRIQEKINGAREGVYKTVPFASAGVRTDFDLDLDKEAGRGGDLLCQVDQVEAGRQVWSHDRLANDAYLFVPNKITASLRGRFLVLEGYSRFLIPFLFGLTDSRSFNTTLLACYCK